MRSPFSSRSPKYLTSVIALSTRAIDRTDASNPVSGAPADKPDPVVTPVTEHCQKRVEGVAVLHNQEQVSVSGGLAVQPGYHSAAPQQL